MREMTSKEYSDMKDHSHLSVDGASKKLVECVSIKWNGLNVVRNISFSNVEFSELDLVNTKFQDCYFYHCTFELCDVICTRFEMCTMHGVLFDHCRIDCVSFLNSALCDIRALGCPKLETNPFITEVPAACWIDDGCVHQKEEEN